MSKFKLDYEGIWKPGAFCEIEVINHNGNHVIMATDCSDLHHNTSITNRIERVMYLAWIAAGKNPSPIFVERYMHKNQPKETERVIFKDFPQTRRSYSGGRLIGEEFMTPEWRPLRKEHLEHIGLAQVL